MKKYQSFMHSRMVLWNQCWPCTTRCSGQPTGAMRDCLLF